MTEVDRDEERHPLGSEGSSAHTLFVVEFASAMGEADSARLRAALGMTTHFHPSHPAVGPPLGFAPLGSGSGLFLIHQGDRWALECRTWGEPVAETVKRWLLSTTYVVHQLDPGVAQIPPTSG